MPTLQFWFDFASTYSYLSAMRIEALAKAAGVDIVWRPFLLGPIFKAQGWATSPFNLYPAKGRYMVRDIQRIAEARGLPFTLPAVFPANSLLAARLALIGEREGWIAGFTKAVFAAEFGRGEDIAKPEAMARLLAPLALDAEALLGKAGEPDVKDALRRQTEQASSIGIFGAPSFVTAGGELFWGDDRLEQAMGWARKEDPSARRGVANALAPGAR